MLIVLTCFSNAITSPPVPSKFAGLRWAIDSIGSQNRTALHNNSIDRAGDPLLQFVTLIDIFQQLDWIIIVALWISPYNALEECYRIKIHITLTG